jgi:hypothetical protein
MTPRGFYNEIGEFYEHKPRSIPKIAKEYRLIYCEICQATLSPIPLDPTKRFECWECVGCHKQITHKQIRDSMHRAKATLETQLPEIKILLFLKDIAIQSNEFIGTDRRSIKKKPLTKESVDLIHDKFTSLVYDDLKVRVRKLNDLLVH